MRRVYFNLTGLNGIQKGGPVLWLNFPDAEEACAFHNLKMATAEEIAKVDSGESEDGMVHDLLQAVDVLKRGGPLPEVAQVISRADLFTADPEVLLEKYDRDEVLFTGEFLDMEDGLLAVLAAVGLQKAAFDFVVPASPMLADSLQVIAKEAETANWKILSKDGAVRLTCGVEVEGSKPLREGGVNVPPKLDITKRARVEKVDLGPFKNIEDFVKAIHNAIQPGLQSGRFGMVEYMVEGEPAEEVPQYAYLAEVSETHVVVGVWLGNNGDKHWRVQYTTSAQGEITLSEEQEQVFPVTVWIREGETAQAVPLEEGEVQPATGAPEGEGTQEPPVEMEEKSAPTLLPTKKFSVMKAELSGPGEDRRYVLGVVLEPNDGKDGPLNPDTQGDVYSAADIEKAAHKWMADFLNVGLMHAELVGRRIVPVESYIAPQDLEIGEQKIGKGAWMLGAVIEDEALWKAVKEGSLTGWSMGGFAVREAL